MWNRVGGCKTIPPPVTPTKAEQAATFATADATKTVLPDAPGVVRLAATHPVTFAIAPAIVFATLDVAEDVTRIATAVAMSVVPYRRLRHRRRLQSVPK